MSSSSPPGTNSLPILLVEDEPAVMELMRTALERSGYSTVPAGSGVEALKLLAAGKYLGVITDMKTPGGVSGADVHAWIGANRRDLVSRVIFVTGDTISGDTVALLEHTGAPCVEKPFRMQQLIGVVEKVLGKP